MSSVPKSGATAWPIAPAAMIRALSVVTFNGPTRSASWPAGSDTTSTATGNTASSTPTSVADRPNSSRYAGPSGNSADHRTSPAISSP